LSQKRLPRAQEIAVKFDLTAPCSSCPFRRDVAPYLILRRVSQILNDILTKDLGFACHKTTQAGSNRRVLVSEHQHCAGALILIKNAGRPSRLFRLAVQLGLLIPSRLSRRARVHTPHSMLAAARSIE
jgi:hypothetical protein